MRRVKERTVHCRNRKRVRNKFSISFIKYKSLRSFARAVGSYKARTTANGIAHNMSVIL
jgi:hypothetical protein